MFLKTILDASEKAGTFTLILANDEGTGEEAIVLSVGEWKRLTKTAPLCETDEITEEIYDSLHAAAERTAAVREAARLLGSSDHSASEIRRKLKFRGISAEAAEYAVALLQKKGYLNDGDACARYAEAALRSKHYGRRRIFDYLLAHGYEREAALDAAQSLSDEEVREALIWQIEHKFPEIVSFERSQKQKAVQSLMRLGFTADEIFAEIKERR